MPDGLSGKGAVRGQFELIEHLGELVLAHLIAEDGGEFVAKLPEPPGVPNGEWMEFAVDPKSVHLFDAQSGLRK